MNAIKLFATRLFTTKPWLPEHGAESAIGGSSRPMPSGKVALLVFLGVATSLFMLCLIAYHMRMKFSDWQPMPEPGILWFNSALLVLASVAMQWAATAAVRGHASFRPALLAGGLLVLGFLAGQLAAWQQLQQRGYFVAGNPANSFFYFLTALHGLHLLGGLVAWSWVIGQLKTHPARVPVAVGLCTLYWHFLLLVWLILFGLLLLS